MSRAWEIRFRNLTLITVVITALVGFAGLVFFITPPAGASNLSIGGPSDCDDNAVIRCGAHSVGMLVDDYRNSAYVKAVYGSFGISRSDMNNLTDTAVMGTVTKQGDVFVNGRLVARNAITGGRQDMPGSTRVDANGAVFFRRPPSVSFVSDSLPAFVSMTNGRFQFAIIASCGNAVAATPVAPPKTAAAPARPVTQAPKPQPTPPAPTPTPTPTPMSTPTPAPTQTQTQSQSQQVTQNQEVTVEAAAPAPTPTPTPAPVPSEQAPAQAPAAAALPNTGPGDIFGLFAATGLAGFFGYRRFLLRKF